MMLARGSVKCCRNAVYKHQRGKQATLMEANLSSLSTRPTKIAFSVSWVICSHQTLFCADLSEVHLYKSNTGKAPLAATPKPGEPHPRGYDTKGAAYLLLLGGTVIQVWEQCMTGSYLSATIMRMQGLEHKL